MSSRHSVRPRGLSVNWEKEFKDRYNGANDSDLRYQVEYLARLGNHYKAQGMMALDNAWIDLLRAHAVFNSCYVRDQDERWQKAAYRLQTFYWAEHVRFTFYEQKVSTADLKSKLTSLRQAVREKLQYIDAIMENWEIASESSEHHLGESARSDFCEKIFQVSTDYPVHMKRIFSQIVATAVNVCGRPPCEYAVLSLGMLVDCEYMPYCDLTFLFLVEHKCAVEYFQRLAVTLYFFILNLGETKLDVVDIHQLHDWFEDAAAAGLSVQFKDLQEMFLDQYDTSIRVQWIHTVDELVQLHETAIQDEAVTQQETEDGNCDFSILRCFQVLQSSSSYVYGSQTLHERLRSQLVASLYSERSVRIYIKLMRKIVVSKSKTAERHTECWEQISLFSSFFFYFLKFLFHVDESEPIKVVSLLEQSGAISKTMAKSLLFLHCCYYYMALSSERKVISFLPCSPTDHQFTTVWYAPKMFTLQLFCHLIPVLERLLNSITETYKFKDDLVYHDLYAASIAHYHRVEFQSFLDGMKKVFGADYNSCASPQLCSMIMQALKKCCDFEKLEIVAKATLSHLPELGLLCYVNMAHSCFGRGLIEDSEQMYGKTLLMLAEGEYPALARREKTAACYWGLGQCMFTRGRYREAEEHFRSDHDILLSLDSERNNRYKRNIAAALAYIANCQRTLGQCQSAKENYIDAIRIYIKIRGPHSVHCDISTAETAKGNLLFDEQNFEQAQNCFQKALDIDQHLYQGCSHVRVAEDLQNLGVVNLQLNNCVLALQQFHQALDVYKDLKKTSALDHKIAVSHRKIGFAYCKSGQLDRSEHHLKLALKPCDSKHGPAYHIDNALAWTHFAGLTMKKKQYHDAEEFYLKALNMFHAIFGHEVPHALLADAYNNTAYAALRAGNQQNAEHYALKSFDMFKRLKLDNRSIRFAKCLDTMGAVALERGDLTAAESYYRQAVEMLDSLQMSGIVVCADFVITYRTLSQLCEKNGKIAEALELSKKALDLH